MSACRVAPSLGALEGTHQEVWGTEDYVYSKHKNEPTVFFGMYDLRDYLALWRHKGKKWILWAGSDLRNLEAGFIFNDGKLKWLSKILRGNWWVLPILRKAEHWVESSWEKDTLQKLGFHSKVQPSFMGNVKDYEISFTPGNKVYLSASEGRQEEYGWWRIERVADSYPELEFHLYGAEWFSAHPNVICHGRVPKEQMNEEIKHMQCGLRLNLTDGFSEVTAKSILWGQYPMTVIPFPMIESAKNLMDITEKKEPNIVARNYYLKRLNAYPWNKNK